MARKRGFTLVELMIAVAIVSILAAIALPSYRQAVIKSGRAEAKGALLRTSQLLERYYTSNGAYPAVVGAAYSNAAPLVTAASITSNEDPLAPGKYNIVMVPAAVNGTALQAYTLTATAVAPFSDPDVGGCGSFSLNSAGVRTFTGKLAKDLCW